MDEGPRFGPYHRAHLLLRGRYRYLLPLMCIFGMAAAAYGYRSRQVIYCSDGLIHIAVRLPEVMQETDQNAPMHMYPEYVQSQVTLLQSPAVMQLAEADPQMKYGDGLSGDLDVENPPNSESIAISYLSPNPEIAVADVRALIGAYVKICKQNNEIEQRKRFEVLADRKRALTQEISQVSQAMLHKAIIPSIPEIASHDNIMKAYVGDQSRTLDQLDALINRGLGPNEPKVKNLSMRLRELNQKMEAFRQDWTRLELAQVMRPRHLRSQTGVFPELQGLEQKLDNLTDDLTQTIARQDVLATEARLGISRVTVQDWGSISPEPAIDHRFSVASVFGMSGAAAPLLMFLMFGYVERRYRFSDDALDTRGGLPLLSVIPEWSKRMDEEEFSRITAHCAHTLRIRLQTIGRLGPQRLFMITSASAGEGKTSVTLSLGFSFAASGARTLLIDCDVIGRGLTRRLESGNAPGLIDCLDDPARAIVKDVSDNLWLLPAGRGFAKAAPVLTPQKLRALIAVVGAGYDVVLIDTGPLLFSMEASAVAPLADRVILVVAQGEPRKNAQAAMQMLRPMGARVAGFVFNRAKATDYYRSIGGSLSSYSPSAGRQMPAPAVAETKTLALRPDPAERELDLQSAGLEQAAPDVTPARGLSRFNDSTGEDGLGILTDNAVITAVSSLSAPESGNSDSDGHASAFAFFSEQPLAPALAQPPTVVMTVINGPAAAIGDADGAREGFAGRRPDGQMDAAPCADVDPAAARAATSANADSSPKHF
jgi:Mrp family chromosome partitioning ATPase